MTMGNRKLLGSIYLNSNQTNPSDSCERSKGFSQILVLGLLALIAIGIYWWLGQSGSKTAPETVPIAKTNSRTLIAQPKVLIVHSYHPEYAWVASLSFGIKKALAGSKAQIETFYMDTKRNTSADFKTEMGKKALAVVEDWKPDIVITTDDNAQAYFGKHLAGRTTPQVVFCGVNNPIENYGYPKPNVTGVKEKPHFLDTMQLFERLRPNSKRFLFLSDNSPTSKGALHYLESNDRLKQYDIGIELPNNIQEWKEIVRKQSQTYDAIMTYVYHTINESPTSEKKMEPSEVLGWTIENSKVPVIALLPFAIDAGAMVGVVESGAEHGFVAGQMARQIIEGTPTSEIPVKKVLKGKTMINLKSSKHFGIEIPAEELSNQSIVITGM